MKISAQGIEFVEIIDPEVDMFFIYGEYKVTNHEVMNEILGQLENGNVPVSSGSMNLLFINPPDDDTIEFRIAQ